MSSSLSPEPRRYLIAIGSPYCPNMELPNLKRVKPDIRKVTELFEKQGYKKILESIGETSDDIQRSIVNSFSRNNFKSSDV